MLSLTDKPIISPMQKSAQTAPRVSILGQILARQQQQMAINKRQSALLITYAHNDHEKIARLIQLWLKNASPRKRKQK